MKRIKNRLFIHHQKDLSDVIQKEMIRIHNEGVLIEMTEKIFFQ